MNTNNSAAVQLDIFDKLTPIETICIEPTKEMPIEVFKECHRLSYYLELMERLPDGRVVWDENATSIYSEEIAEAEYQGLQHDWFSMTFEIPKAWFERNLNS